MHIISRIELAVVWELAAAPPAGLERVTYHPSIDGPAADLPAVIVTAAAEEIIPGNQTYDVSLTVDLHTQADDTPPEDAREFAQKLSALLAEPEFLVALQDMAQDWFPIHLRLRNFDAIQADDRRYVHRVQLRMMAQA